MKLYTFTDILHEYENLCVKEEATTDFETHLRDNYRGVYNEDGNFIGYELILDAGVGYDRH